MAIPPHPAFGMNNALSELGPRFGLYRDRRAETQTMYIDRIMFWNADPYGHPDWAAQP